MSVIESIHGTHVHTRRVRILSEQIAAIIPRNASVLDIGCGDGRISKLIAEKRPDITVQGVEVLVRDDAVIPVTKFDGTTLPFEDNSFDCTLFIDVLHHTEDPMVLLKEAHRVARTCIIMKDHLEEGALAHMTLRFMDRVGNARYGVALPHNYWKKRQWMRAADDLQMEITTWNEHLGLYPFPFSMIFERGLHMISRWEKS